MRHSPDLFTCEQFEPVGPEEVDLVFRTVSSATCSLDPCLRRRKVGMWCGWVLAVVKSSLREGVAPLEALVHSLLKKPSLDPSVLDNFYQCLSSLLSGRLWRHLLYTSFSNLWVKRNSFSTPFELLSVRIQAWACDRNGIVFACE